MSDPVLVGVPDPSSYLSYSYGFLSQLYPGGGGLGRYDAYTASISGPFHNALAIALGNLRQGGLVDAASVPPEVVALIYDQAAEITAAFAQGRFLDRPNPPGLHYETPRDLQIYNAGKEIDWSTFGTPLFSIPGSGAADAAAYLQVEPANAAYVAAAVTARVPDVAMVEAPSPQGAPPPLPARDGSGLMIALIVVAAFLAFLLGGA